MAASERQALPVDFHSHILPALDDGSDSPETSLQMLEHARRMGTELMVATPHFYAQNETPSDFLERRAQSVSQLLQGGYRRDAHPRVLLGAEVAYFPGIGRCAELSELCIVGTHLILIEMPFRPWSQTVLEDLYSIQTHLGLIPVLAHIERYPIMRSPLLVRTMIHRGILMQINASMADHAVTRRRALRLLTRGEVQLIGSDCHNMTTRRPGTDQLIAHIRQHAPADFLPQMVEFNRFLLRGAVPIDRIKSTR